MAVILALMLRPTYPGLKVYAFATPGKLLRGSVCFIYYSCHLVITWVVSAGLLSREAARYTESFVFTIGVGDDFVMRLSVESAENLRCKILQVLAACRLPKVLKSALICQTTTQTITLSSVLSPVSYYDQWIRLRSLRYTLQRFGIHLADGHVNGCAVSAGSVATSVRSTSHSFH